MCVNVDVDVSWQILHLMGKWWKAEKTNDRWLLLLDSVEWPTWIRSGGGGGCQMRAINRHSNWKTLWSSIASWRQQQNFVSRRWRGGGNHLPTWRIRASDKLGHRKSTGQRWYVARPSQHSRPWSIHHAGGSQARSPLISRLQTSPRRPPFLSIIGNLASVEPADLIPIIIRPDHNTELIGGWVHQLGSIGFKWKVPPGGPQQADQHPIISSSDENEGMPTHQ